MKYSGIFLSDKDLIVMMKRWIFLALTILFTLPTTNAREFLSIGALTNQSTRATAERFPDSDEVLLDNYIQIRYQADGTSESWDDTAIKILTEKGKRNHQILTLSFNTSYGTNYFSNVQIIKPDGSIQKVDVEVHSRVMVDPSQMSANIYNPNSKILQLSVPGLEIGDIIRSIAHGIRTKTVVPDTWSDYQVFEHSAPILKTTYEVIAPRERPLKNIALKDEIPGTVTHEREETEETIVYRWKVTEVPRMFDEPDMPARYTVVQRLLVSTIETWEHLSSWYWELCKPRLEATTPEMEAKAQELAAGKESIREKVEAIFNFVSQDIRYMGITTEEEAPGYEPHDVKITFENRYGVCRDKAALLVAMLRMVDIEAFPVIIMAGPKKDEEVPQPFFNHAVTAALDEDGSYILMDPTDENTKDIFPSYLQNMSYIVARPEGETLLTSPVIPATNNLVRITTDGELDENGKLTATSTLLFEGVNDTVYRGYFSKIKPEERRRFFEGHLKKNMPTASLTEFTMSPTELRDTTQPLTIQLRFSAANLLIQGGGKSLLEMPRLGRTLGYANFLIGQTGLTERKYPLYTRITAGVEERISLQIPADAGQIQIPDFTAIDTELLQAKSELSQRGDTLDFHGSLLLHTVEFSPEQYLTLKQNLKEMEYNHRKRVILVADQKEQAEEADIRILSSSNHIELQSATNWTETIHNRLEILTYAGTKQQAELKYGYNPAWQHIELLSATVTQPDGSIKEISPEEINIMDAAWVASAPRYPAEKILVANLPAVKVGSVIDYKIRSTVTGKPFFSYSNSFIGHNPIEQQTFSISAPVSLELRILNTGIEETKTVTDGTVSYLWSATNQPAVKNEEALPDWSAFNPSVFVSTSDWRSYANQLRTALTAAVTNQPATAQKAMELTAGLTDEREQILAIRNWVAQNIRPAGPPLTSLPLPAITPSDQTLADRYGNSTDRSILLYTMLETTGFDPEFTLSGAVSLLSEENDPHLMVPTRHLFDALLIKVRHNNETLYLDGTSQYRELGTTPYERRAALELSTGNLGTILIHGAKTDRQQTRIDLSILPTGHAIFTSTQYYHGNAFEGFHRMYAEMTPEKRRRHHLELIAAISQSAQGTAELTTNYATYPGIRSFTVEAERYAVVDGDYLYFTLPDASEGLLAYRASERKNPLAWRSFIDRKVDFYITIPEGYEAVMLPGNVQWQAPQKAGTISVELKQQEQQIEISYETSLKPALLPANVYPEILDIRKQLAHPDMRTILLKKVAD
jgi:transglutaminase-like putative cysteine protease